MKKATTKRAAANAEFFRQKTLAEKKYGIAAERPQDNDPSFLRSTRRTNYGLIADFPENYREDLAKWIDSMPTIPVTTVPKFSMKMVTLQDATNQDDQLLRRIRSAPGQISVLAVDFEFHQEFSYDGFICVASVSSPDKTLVVDCLNENRKFAIDWMSKMLKGKRTLKVFAGCQNDIFRVRKDWGVFLNNAIDIQDLFVVWRNSCYQKCLEMCKTLVVRRLNEQKKDVSPKSVEKYLSDLNMPGLSFLTEVFFPMSDASKDKLATYADWRHRPLHADLIWYSASDSFYTLSVFYALYAEVGDAGLKSAAKKTSEKLLNSSSLPRYPDNVISTFRGQFTVDQLYKWRRNRAKNSDKTPDQVLHSKNIPRCASELEEVDLTDTRRIAQILRKYRVSDDIEKNAKLVAAYLEPDGSTLKHMETLICHNCNQVGHVAQFFFYDSMPESKRQFRSRPENAEFEIHQAQRRRNNYCLKRGLDPATTICPWEKKTLQK